MNCLIKNLHLFNNLLNSFYKISGIPFLIIDKKGDVIYSYDKAFEHKSKNTFDINYYVTNGIVKKNYIECKNSNDSYSILIPIVNEFKKTMGYFIIDNFMYEVPNKQKNTLNVPCFKKDKIMTAIDFVISLSNLNYTNFVINSKNFEEGHTFLTKYNIDKLFQKNSVHNKILSALPTYLIVKNRNLKYVYVNKHFLKTFNLNINEVIGKTDFDFFSRDFAKLSMEADIKLMQDETMQYNKEEEFLGIDGIVHTCIFSKIPFENANNLIDGIIVIGYDVTDLKNKEREIFQIKKALEESSLMKTQFLTNINHELRTPLNGIMGTIKLLNKTQLTSEQKEYLNSLEICSNDLLNIINDLIDASMIERGSIKVHHTSFNVNDLLIQTVNIFKSSAMDKNLSLNLHIDENIPQNIIGDELKLQQILKHLIANAIKFTLKGEINVHLKLLNKTFDSCELNFSVEDTGIGISSNKLDKLFDIFTQLDNSSTRKYRGIGAGLSITKKLLHMMNGTLSVESNLGKGSIFTFIIPFKIDASITQNPNEENASNINHNNKLKILLVDDTAINQQILKKILEKEGYCTILADNGIDAIYKYKNENPDLILMDIQMPEMDGYEASKLIRTYEKNKDSRIPIIAMTANTLDTDKEKCLSSGMDDYLSKPIDLEKTLSKIYKWLHKNSNINAKTLYIDFNKQLKKLQEEFPIDNDTAENFLNDFFILMDETLEEINNHIKNNNLEQLAKCAHKLKGTALNLYIAEIAELSLKLEKASKQNDLVMCKKIYSILKQYKKSK